MEKSAGQSSKTVSDGRPSGFPPRPSWYDDAKFGIFIHWGLYSVPAFAPTQYGDITETVGKHGYRFHFAHNPYAEWYQNSIRIFKDDYKEFHTREFGASFPYEDFAPIFNERIKKWNPDEWAGFFSEIGAKYVVLTTKHHDGFTLWKSCHPNPNIEGYHADRDIVGELAEAVRARGLKFGTYYSGFLDWSFTKKPIVETTTLLASGPKTALYGSYCKAHYFELIEKYKPDILWNDIGYPPNSSDLNGVVSYFFKHVPNGAINDRWTIIPRSADILQYIYPVRWIINAIGKLVVKRSGFVSSPPRGFAHYTTPEYSPAYKLTAYKWEACRGIGRSFGYNRMEDERHYLGVDDLIVGFIDIISKNGNLLLNIGPTAGGKIPKLQKERLRALGDFIRANSFGIFGTRPWIRAEGFARIEYGIQNVQNRDNEGKSKGITDSIPIRFTRRGADLIVFFLCKGLAGMGLFIGDIPHPEGRTPSAFILNSKGFNGDDTEGHIPIDIKREGNGIFIRIPEDIPNKNYIAIAIEGVLE